ncbi:MAG: regulatory protein fmdb family [Mycobacterium sp.]|nr:regulatory protein fmdb family [Mycobacterium sp.]
MPTYQYVCTACNTPLEAVQSFSDPALTECPACGGRLRKVFSAVGVVFKGSGFYKTDSREAAKPKAASSPSDGSTTGDKSAGSTTTPAAPAASGSGSSGSSGGSGGSTSSSSSSTGAASSS